MIRASDRSVRRRDTALFLVCVALSLVALFASDRWGQGVAGALRDTLLYPLVWLQSMAEEGRTSRTRFQHVVEQRDSAAIVAQALPALRAENERLRQLLTLSRRLTTPYVSAEVLHQAQATDGRTLLLDAGLDDGIAAFDPIVAPEGLIGMVSSVGGRTSVGMTWAHPEFRVSAFTVDGNAFGIVAPSSVPTATEVALEFRGVPYRDSVPTGAMVFSSGLGGVYPKGIPIGTVVGVVREQAGWERVYRLQPAANPASASHVMILVTPRQTNVARGFPSDSAVAAERRDSLDRARRADSLLTARRQADSLARVARAAARAARADSIRRIPRPARPDTAPADTARPAPVVPRARLDTTRPEDAPPNPTAPTAPTAPAGDSVR